MKRIRCMKLWSSILVTPMVYFEHFCESQLWIYLLIDIFWVDFSMVWNLSRSLKKRNLAKTLEKWYFLEGARNGQETMERLDINHDEDAWIRDMRFWWPLWCILITFMIWSLKLRGFNKQNLAKVFGFWGVFGGWGNRMTFNDVQSSLPGLRDFD